MLIQNLVWPVSLSGRPVHRLRENLFTGRPLTESDHTRCCINTICPPVDEHYVARNM